MSHQLILLLVLIVLLVFPAIEDLKTRRIRNLYFVILIFLRIIYLFILRDAKELLSSCISFLASLLIFGFCYFVLKDGIGFGDIKLLLGMSFYLGFELFLRDLFLISLGSLLFSLFLLATKQVGKKSEIPFAPFILAGTIVATLVEVIG